MDNEFFDHDADCARAANMVSVPARYCPRFSAHCFLRTWDKAKRQVSKLNPRRPARAPPPKREKVEEKLAPGDPSIESGGPEASPPLENKRVHASQPESDSSADEVVPRSRSLSRRSPTPVASIPPLEPLMVDFATDSWRGKPLNTIFDDYFLGREPSVHHSSLRRSCSGPSRSRRHRGPNGSHIRHSMFGDAAISNWHDQETGRRKRSAEMVRNESKGCFVPLLETSESHLSPSHQQSRASSIVPSLNSIARAAPGPSARSNYRDIVSRRRPSSWGGLGISSETQDSFRDPRRRAGQVFEDYDPLTAPLEFPDIISEYARICERAFAIIHLQGERLDQLLRKPSRRSYIGMGRVSFSSKRRSPSTPSLRRTSIEDPFVSGMPPVTSGGPLSSHPIIRQPPRSPSEALVTPPRSRHDLEVFELEGDALKYDSGCYAGCQPSRSTSSAGITDDSPLAKKGANGKWKAGMTSRISVDAVDH